MWGVLCCMQLASGRAVKSTGGKKKPQLPSIGDALDLHAPDDYIGKDWQAVSVITPLSSNRRQLSHTTGQWKGMRRRRGMITWMKKREGWPFEAPNKYRFKHRILREDPAGVMLTLAQEGKLQLRTGTKNGKQVLSVSLAKPSKPWWRPF